MERVTNDFIEANRDTIKCLALNAADAAFSAAAALRNVGEDTPMSLWFVYDAIVASASVLSCAAPPRKFFEETFEGVNKKCQCAEVGGQLFLEWLDAAGNRTTLSNSELVEAKQIKDAGVTDGVANCDWVTVDGQDRVSTYDLNGGSTPIWYIVPTLNTECCTDTPSPVAPQPYPAPYVFPVENGECVTTVELIDSCIDRYGFSQNFYKVKEDPVCNSNSDKRNYFYWESIQGPYVYYLKAWDSFPGFRCEPPYAPPHPHARIPTPLGISLPGLSPVQYHLDVGCTYNPDTDDFDTKYKYDVEGTNDGIFGLSRRMDALAWMINNAQLIPYTSCATQKPVLEGQWVTTRWESDEKMAHSGRRLRKLFRYRTKSSWDLGQLSAYWENFTWKSGDVCVRHTGAWWGDPQVWAESAEEGQRVIRHAAAEAGIDPDQVGRWAVSSSRSPRYGMSGTMRILRNQDFPWVASRSGAPWPNVLAKPRDPKGRTLFKEK